MIENAMERSHQNSPHYSHLFLLTKKWQGVTSATNIVKASSLFFRFMPTNPQEPAVKHRKGVGTLNLLPHCGSGLPG